MSTRLSILKAEYEVDGSAFNRGRVDFHKGDTDNPWWEGGLARAFQCDAAIDWLDGYESEFDLASKTSSTLPDTMQKQRAA
jgi:hypothetical protein